jgi:hypothetical protein
MSLEQALEAADDIERVGGVYKLVAAAIRYQNKEQHGIRQSKGLGHTVGPNGSNPRNTSGLS